MTQDEIIEMAKQAGFVEKDAMFRSVYLANIKDLEAFAKLVEEHEREWVGLTEEEIEASKPTSSNDAVVWELAVEWAEAKLRSKNNA
jgi:hypothetical protein